MRGPYCFVWKKTIPYMTEVNGNPGTSIIDITGHNYFTDLVKHIGARKQAIAKAAADGEVQDNENQASAMASYPTDMLHAGMTSQQVVGAVAGLILNDASPAKMRCMEVLGDEILDNANASETTLILDDMTRIAMEMHLDDRFGASVDHQIATSVALVPAKMIDKLSEASTQALEYFKSLRKG